MESIRPPKALVLDGNISDNWRKFKQNLNIYMIATGFDEKPPNKQAAILLNVIGEEALELFNTFTLTAEERQDIEKVVEKFEEYCKPRKNVVIERYIFHTRKQEENEPFDRFLNDLKKLVKTCEFNDQADSVIRDRIVLGIADKNMQERLLRVPDLDMNKAIELARASELSKLQALTLHDRKEVNYFKINAKSRERTTRHEENGGHRKEQLEKKKSSESLNVGEHYSYIKCKSRHRYRECPAFGKTCRRCGKLNHFVAGCKFKRVKEVALKTEDSSDQTGSETEDEGLFKIHSVGLIKKEKNKGKWKETILVEGKKIVFKLDTGAEVNIMPYPTLKEMKLERKIKDTGVLLEAWGGQVLKPLGIIELKCLGKKGIIAQKFIVVNNEKINDKPLLGGESCVNLGYVKRIYGLAQREAKDKEQFIKENIEVFRGHGAMEKEWKIRIKKGVEPVARPPRRVPLAIQDRLKTTLYKLEKKGIISKVEEPNGWVSGLVVVEKTNGSLRICIDPKELNRAITREHVLIPTLEEITAKLSGKTVFSVLDLRDGFWHIKLDQESSKLCTFSTPIGCFKFNRLPFGLTSAPELFQKINQESFGDIDGVIIYFDDLLIAGSSVKEHDRILEKVIARAKELNIRFNKDKVQYRVPEVRYLGHIFCKNGIKTDPERIRAILELETPQNKKEVQRILGMLGYLRRFIPRMSELTTPLRELLKKDRDWQWLPCHSTALEKLKQTITTQTVLKSYSRGQPLTIQADASKSGLGCCLMQDSRPIAYASRRLTETEKAYAQVEKELLGILFAVNKFHYYIYGTKVKVLTDHKPLVSIMEKEVGNIMSPRLQRMRMKLLRYDLEVLYIPGKDMLIADALSRSYIKDEVSDDIELTEMVHNIKTLNRVSDRRLQESQTESDKDPIMVKLKEQMKEGWPRKVKKSLPREVQRLYTSRQDLSVENGIVYLGHKIIVPKKLRKEVLRQLHDSHGGIVKTKARARQLVYWSGLGRDIEKMVKNCRACERHSRENSREPLVKHMIPELPFEKVAVDILEQAGREYLVLVDYYSRWIELSELMNKQSRTIIEALKNIFVLHGIPKIMVADNMPFNSFECQSFAREWKIEIITSSPRYPRSNGLAKKAVGIVKSMMKRCGDEGQDIRIALLEYRNTPVAGLQVAPAQLLMGRRTRTRVPIGEKLLMPKTEVLTKEVRDERAGLMKYYYDRGTRQREQMGTSKSHRST